MCAPAFSPVQYSIDQLDGNGHLSGVHAVLSQLGHSKRIGDFYHFSRPGGGHTTATQYKARVSGYLAEGSHYEGFWWKGPQKMIDKDRPYNLCRSDESFGLVAAQKYYEAACIGNMSIFRRWFLQSIKQADHALQFTSPLMSHVLNKSGSNKLHRKLRSFAKGDDRELMQKIVAGVLRNRKNFKDHFADANHMWTSA